MTLFTEDKQCNRNKHNSQIKTSFQPKDRVAFGGCNKACHTESVDRCYLLEMLWLFTQKLLFCVNILQMGGFNLYIYIYNNYIY